MNTLKSVAAGVAGSAALTGLHQALRNTKDAPRVDLLGEQAVVKYFSNGKKRRKKEAYYGAMAGDIVSNSIYYGLLARSKSPVLMGLGMGAAAGYLAVITPGLFGLKKRYVKSTPRKKYMTVGYYAFGGLVAGLVAKMLR